METRLLWQHKIAHHYRGRGFERDRKGGRRESVTFANAGERVDLIVGTRKRLHNEPCEVKGHGLRRCVAVRSGTRRRSTGGQACR